MNLTLEQLSADIWRRQQRNGDSSLASLASPLMPAELLCATLDTMSSRQLLKLKGISHQLAGTVDHILRCRMIAITTSKDFEVLFSCCSPMDASRAHRQVLRLSHIDPSCITGASEVATFTMAADPPLPQILALDDEESFSLHLAAIQLGAVPPPLPSPPLTPDPSTSMPPLPSFASTFFAPPPQRWDFQVSLGSAYPRLFRSWFEDPSLAHTPSAVCSSYPSPASSPEQDHSYKLHRTSTSLQTLHIPPSPLSPSSLLSATLRCTLVAPSPPPPSSTLRGHYGASPRGYTPTPPRLLEYTYEEVRVDVGRFVVAAEEGMGMCEGGSGKVLLVLGR